MFAIVDDRFLGGGLAAVAFVGIVGSLLLGRWVAKRFGPTHDVEGSSGVGSLETAIFALLGLMIAFTFSGGLSRYDQRRAQAVDEANAIGTAYLRIDLVAESARPKLREAFRGYVDARIATYKSLPNVEAARRELARSQKLQDQIWDLAVAATRLPDTRPGTDLLLIPAVNQMFDIAAVRIAATIMHPPTIIYAMLIGLAIASALLAGVQRARYNYDWMHKLGFAAIIALTIYVILEIEYPRLGFVRLDDIDQLLVNARAAMN
jgi:hypothetical protein